MKKFNKENTLTVTTPINVTYQRLSDLLCGAFEGGSTYWCESAFRKGDITKEQAEYIHDVPFVEGGWLAVNWCDNDTGKPFKLDLEAVQKGLNIFAQKYPKHFTDFIESNDDACTSDVFLQCIMFGEAIYG